MNHNIPLKSGWGPLLDLPPSFPVISQPMLSKKGTQKSFTQKDDNAQTSHILTIHRVTGGQRAFSVCCGLIQYWSIREKVQKTIADLFIPTSRYKASAMSENVHVVTPRHKGNSR